MTEPVRAPEGAELPDADVAVPPAGSSEEELLTALVAALIAGAFVGKIASILGRFPGLTRSLVVQMVQLVSSWGHLMSATSTEIALLPRDEAPAVRVLHQIATVNAFRRAAYLVNSARRLAPALSAGDQGRIDRALQAEDRYFAAHERAERKRNESARIVAEEASRYGTNERGELLLGWEAVIDARTSADCRWAHKRNFNALVRPPIGYPGEVHIDCRCRPRRPWNTRRRVERGKVPTHD